jgi:DNA-directed RNA polymerase subunit RPC12/RpoP
LLLVVKCVECGKEYVLEQGEDLSEFQCKCGGNLELKKYGVQEPPKSKIPIKKISISVISIVIILFVLLTVFNTGFSSIIHINSTNQTNISNNTTPPIATKTYAANDITFNYPADWQAITDLDAPSRWGYQEPVCAFYDPASTFEGGNIQTYFYIKENPRSYESLDDMLRYYRSDITEIGQTEVSERNITVNGMKAVELIKTWYNDNEQYQAITVHIEAVPGAVYYRIGCVVPQNKYNATLPKFEVVINSFKYTG